MGFVLVVWYMDKSLLNKQKRDHIKDNLLPATLGEGEFSIDGYEKPDGNETEYDLLLTVSHSNRVGDNKPRTLTLGLTESANRRREPLWDVDTLSKRN